MDNTRNQNQERNEIRNPLEYADVHRNATVTMENHFQPANCETRGEEPLKFFSKWSYVSVALINSKRESAAYRIYPREMGIIRRRTDAMIYKSIWDDGESGEASSPAYTTPLQGRYKGMTAAEALRKFGPDALMQQYQYLQQHLNSNFAKSNEMQMNAIKDAIILNNEGRLENKGTSKVIFDSGIRGRSSVARQLKIVWGTGDFPVKLTINLWRGVNINAGQNGTQTFDLKKAILNSVSVSLSAEEWADLVDSTMDQIHMHKLMLFPTAFKIATQMHDAAISQIHQGQNARDVRTSEQAPADESNYDFY